jgi:hypothetical protein
VADKDGREWEGIRVRVVGGVHRGLCSGGSGGMAVGGGGFDGP